MCQCGTQDSGCPDASCPDWVATFDDWGSFLGFQVAGTVAFTTPFKAYAHWAPSTVQADTIKGFFKDQNLQLITDRTAALAACTTSIDAGSTEPQTAEEWAAANGVFGHLQDDCIYPNSESGRTMPTSRFWRSDVLSRDYLRCSNDNPLVQEALGFAADDRNSIGAEAGLYNAQAANPDNADPSTHRSVLESAISAMVSAAFPGRAKMVQVSQGQGSYLEIIAAVSGPSGGRRLLGGQDTAGLSNSACDVKFFTL